MKYLSRTLLFIVMILSVGMSVFCQHSVKDKTDYRPSKLSNGGVIAEKQTTGNTSATQHSIEQPDFQLSILRTMHVRDSLYYAITRQNGFLVSHDDGLHWETRNNGLPVRIVYPFDGKHIRTLTSMNIDPGNENRIAVTTAYGLYLTENAGHSWEPIPLKPPVKSSAYITAVSLSPHSDNRFLIGTSFSGLFETKNRGMSWEERPENIELLYRGAGFYEEISGVLYHPTDREVIFLSCGFGNGIYSTDETGAWIESFPFPGDQLREPIKGLHARYLNPRTELRESAGSQTAGTEVAWRMVVDTERSRWHYQSSNQRWTKTQAGHGGTDSRFTDDVSAPAADQVSPKSPKPAAVDGNTAIEKKQQRIDAASDRYGIYIGAHNAGGDKIDPYLDFLLEHDCNTIVIDMKNDRGWITYNTDLALPHTIGAVWEAIDLETLLNKAHNKGIYVIARIVVFKDKNLYSYKSNAYAVWNSERSSAWGHKFKIVDEESDEVRWEQREHWVDPYSEFVWEYNIAIAQELQDRGVDEIQFDYIRFPSDGNFSGVTYRHKKDGMTKTEAIESFLKIAREKITIPISTDLYGFNCWYRMGNWIGQNIEMISHYADAICPMFYPSHFPRTFMQDVPYLDRAQKLYLEGSDRAAMIVQGRSAIRPYIQAFLIGGELKFEEPTYTDYLLKQIKGTNQSAASGFTLWNNSNSYYMVTVPLNTYIKPKPEESKADESLLN